MKQSGPVAGGQYGKHMCMQQSDGAQLQTASKQPADLLPLQYRHCGVHEAVMLRAKCIWLVSVVLSTMGCMRAGC